MRSRAEFISLATAAGAIGVCMLVTPLPGHPAGWLLPMAATLAAAVAVLLATVARSASRHHRLTRRLYALARPVTVAAVEVQELAAAESPFVAGLRRPSIFCAPQLSARLEPDELRAVLLHERYHQLDRAPAKLVVLEALTPALGAFQGGQAWLARRLADMEIAADRHALQQGATRGALARALLKLAPLPAGSVGLGFASATDLRLRALVDEQYADPRQLPPRWLLVPLAVAAFCLLLVLPM